MPNFTCIFAVFEPKPSYEATQKRVALAATTPMATRKQGFCDRFGNRPKMGAASVELIREQNGHIVAKCRDFTTALAAKDTDRPKCPRWAHIGPFYDVSLGVRPPIP